MSSFSICSCIFAHERKHSDEKDLRDHRFYGFRYECPVVKEQPLKESEILLFHVLQLVSDCQTDVDSKNFKPGRLAF